MFVIIGIVLVIGSMLAGYMMHHGQIGVLIQINEFIILGGVAFGSMVVANPMYIIKAIIAGVIQTLSGPKVNKAAYLDLIKMLYELFQFAKREGLIALEPHVENPEGSSIISKYPSFLHNHHAVVFMSDTLKIILSGGVPAHDLEELMDLDLESAHQEEHFAQTGLNTVADAFPGIGIVAAVLGVIITMGAINEGAEVVGASVAAALVGTFLGILLSYGIFGPLARNLEIIQFTESKYMLAIKASLLSFAKGAPSAVAIEYGRRAINPELRPSFKEAEDAIKK
ncbi:MAG: flagellar motor stator protein MotA [Candidatus Kapabacteria bacterium]|nr:flagellar motor stator protein MotA [Candidatus Kapabacteria bacterium]